VEDEGRRAEDEGRRVEDEGRRTEEREGGGTLEKAEIRRQKAEKCIAFLPMRRDLEHQASCGAP